jgi:hypothetical protein
MPANFRRNLLYWYVATNYFRAFGHTNRVKLPPCVLLGIRRRHPSADGQYTGHRPGGTTDINSDSEEDH